VLWIYKQNSITKKMKASFVLAGLSGLLTMVATGILTKNVFFAVPMGLAVQLSLTSLVMAISEVAREIQKK
jgi:hypothetical protein